MWALNILNIIIYLLDAVVSWSKKIISSMQSLDWGFYQHSEIFQRNYNKILRLLELCLSQSLCGLLCFLLFWNTVSTG